MRQCPLKHKECPLKRPLVGRVVCSLEIQVAKATNGQKNGSAEESSLAPRPTIGSGQYFCAVIKQMNKNEVQYKIIGRFEVGLVKLGRLIFSPSNILLPKSRW